MGNFYSISDKTSVAIGRDYRCDIAIDEPHISRVHIIIYPQAGNLTAIVKILSSSKTLIGDSEYSKGTSTTIGKSELINIGGYIVVWLGRYVYITKIIKGGLQDACINNIIKGQAIDITDLCEKYHEKSSNREMFMPAVRRRSCLNMTPIDIEGPPARKLPQKQSLALAAGPALTMAIPIMLGCGRTISIMTSIIAAFWAAGNVISRKRKLKSEERRRRNCYMAYIDECEQKIRQRYKECVAAYNSSYPSVAKVLNRGPDPFLMWNKESADAEYHMYRIGIGYLDFPVDINTPKERFAQIDDSLKEMPDALKSKYQLLPSVPVAIDLKSVYAVGIIYDDKRRLTEVLNAFILQMCICKSPVQLRICMAINDVELSKRLSYVTYLPHWDDVDEKIDKSEDIDGQDLAERILITDDADTISYYACDKVIIIKSRLAHIPTFANLILCIKRDHAGIMHAGSDEGNASRQEILFDTISPKQAEESARLLGRLWGNRDRVDNKIPSVVPFNQVYDEIKTNRQVSEEMLAELVENRWMRSDPIQSLAAPIGIGERYEVIYLDFHERKHGPHGLVAGTTGSGKSELLTTIILSMSIQFPPDKVGFFLIDYKGGGMANQFAHLPHLLGSISNLSEAESNRAMLSLKSENRRRQRIFIEAGVNNINDYMKEYDNGNVTMALPHVFIIIDEFAELKKERPEFMGELISVAAVGRSLGIHLILATQKPSGVVDDKIRSNSKFRICLRVEDKSDSNDMLHKPDAAYITECGRGYLQVGNDEVYKCFQSSYAMCSISGERTGKVKLYDEKMRLMDVATGCEEKVEVQANWHQMFMSAIGIADSRYKGARAGRLWLPRLPDDIAFDLVTDISDEAIVYALGDNPACQCYVDAGINTNEHMSVLVLGAQDSGKSSILTTLSLGIMLKLVKDNELNNNEDHPVWIYVVDLGGGKLKYYRSLKLCGGYITTETITRIPMLLCYIKDIIDKRKSLPDEALCELPPILLIIDNYGEASKVYSEECTQVIGEILKYGRRTKIILLVSALEIGANEFPTKHVDKLDKLIILGTFDCYRMASYLNTQPKLVPQIDTAKGRGVAMNVDYPIEIQCKYTSFDTITSVTNVINTRFSKFVPEYPYIPDNPCLEDYIERAIRKKPPLSDGSIYTALPVGYECQTGRLYEINLAKLSSVIISGRLGTGKRSLLNIISIIASRYNIKTISANCAESLVNVLNTYEHKDTHERLIIRVNDLGALMEELSRSTLTSDQIEMISRYFNNMQRGRKNVTIIGIISEDSRIRPSDSVITENLFKKPYVIYCGGGLDSQRLFDFSYLSYTKQSKRYNPGYATVNKFSKRLFYGDIQIPRLIEEEE